MPVGLLQLGLRLTPRSDVSSTVPPGDTLGALVSPQLLA